MGLLKKRTRQAALVSPLTQGFGSSVGTTRDESWQQKVREYDEGGPGFVGFGFDLVAMVGSMFELFPEVRDPATGQWVRSDDPMLREVLYRFKGEQETQDELFYQILRSFESVGECFLGAIDRDLAGGGGTGRRGLVYTVIQTPQLGNKQAKDEYGRDIVEVSLTPQTGRGRSQDQDKLWIPADQIKRMHVPHRTWPKLATSAVERAIPDIERYVSVVRAMNRATDSRLLVNGIVWLPSEAAQQYAAQTSQNGQPRDFHSDLANLGRRAFDDNQGVNSRLPFSLSTSGEHGPPQHIELGRPISQEELDAEIRALESYARSINLPMKALVSGVGDGSYWADWMLNADVVRTGVAPKVRKATNALTLAFYRPYLEALRRRGLFQGDPDDVRIGADSSQVEKPVDESDASIKAWQAGLMGREEAGRRGFDLGPDEMLELPDGMTDFEFWSSHVANSTAAGATAGNELSAGGAPPSPEGPQASAGGPDVLDELRQAGVLPYEHERDTWKEDK